MWAHYAQNHQGICLGWEGASVRRGMFPVRYDERLFDMTPFLTEYATSGQLNNMTNVVAALHKSPEWKYEREWRMVIPFGTTKQPWQVGIPSPSVIYLGACMERDTETRVRDIGERIGAKMYKMRLRKDAFGLDADEI